MIGECRFKFANAAVFFLKDYRSFTEKFGPALDLLSVNDER